MITSIQEKATVKLLDHVDQVLIIAYKEPTEELSTALSNEGFTCEVLRQQHREEYTNYSPSYLCLLNHCEAWKQVIKTEKPAIIIEADFVPVIGFGQLPLPYPVDHTDTGIAWLYTCAPQIYFVSLEGFAQGFSASTVAYIVTPSAAKVLRKLEEQIRQDPGPMAYSSWDSTIEELLRKEKLKNYLPFRNYGEHGGLPNQEHYQNNLSKTHRADILYDKLAFLPPYAKVKRYERLAFYLERLQGRIKGIARLLFGKYLRLAIIRRHNHSERLIRWLS
jgi:GR25 family glycosyltransferase involved in LPS biosynthesis